MFVSAVIVAGGAGKRMGGSIPKQLLPLVGKPILQHTLERFEACSLIDEIVCVLQKDILKAFAQTIRSEWCIRKANAVVGGGEERHHSVMAGLQAVSAAAELIMIHDGVRPLVSERILRESIQAAAKFGAAVTGLQPKDTIKRISGPQKLETLDRSRLVQVQTPQTFRAEMIRQAYQSALSEGVFSTDDSALIERQGGTVEVVQGDWRNIKITSPEDLIIAEALLIHEVAHRTRI